MFYAEISTLPKTAQRLRILKEIGTSPEGTFTRNRRFTSRRQRTTEYRYSRHGHDITAHALVGIRELDEYQLLHVQNPANPSMYAQWDLILSPLGRRTLLHWEGVTDLPYSITVDGVLVDFTIDLTGRVRAPDIEPFDVHSSAQARDIIRSRLSAGQLHDGRV